MPELGQIQLSKDELLEELQTELGRLRRTSATLVSAYDDVQATLDSSIELNADRIAIDLRARAAQVSAFASELSTVAGLLEVVPLLDRLSVPAAASQLRPTDREHAPSFSKAQETEFPEVSSPGMATPL